MASLLDYVLRLQRDSDEYQKFKSSQQGAKDQMTAAGLSPEQQNVLLSGSSDDLQNALIQEISAGYSSAYNGGGGFVNSMRSKGDWPLWDACDKLTLTFRIPKPQQ